MWFGTRPADWEIRRSLKSYRAQARHLYENNSFAVRAISLMVDNILGADGIRYRATSKDPDGTYDNAANKMLNDAWIEWAKCPDVALQSSWHDIQRIALESVARDGEIFLRIIKDPNLNACGISLQLLESEYVDVDYNYAQQNIRMGIQYDDWGRVLGYWVWNQQPNTFWMRIASKRIFIPADQIIHIYHKDRSSQNRGMSWLAPVMRDLEDVWRYSQAELHAALNGAINVGILERQPGSPGLTGDVPTHKDNGPIIIDNTENLTVIESPVGSTFKKYDNGHPNNQYPAYIKAALRGVAAGLNISYNDLANDYEGVNYSSLRQSALICRDRWQTLQTWFRETVCEDLFDVWLPLALLSGRVGLPPSKIDKFRAHKFVCRTWDWVDPLKDVNATIIALQSGLTTYTRACDELGLDFQELATERANDEKIIKSLGLNFVLSTKTPKELQQPPDKGEVA
jgi:lambda family phage portal protein